jgi:hypothetical protein
MFQSKRFRDENDSEDLSYKQRKMEETYDDETYDDETYDDETSDDNPEPVFLYNDDKLYDYEYINEAIKRNMKKRIVGAKVIYKGPAQGDEYPIGFVNKKLQYTRLEAKNSNEDDLSDDDQYGGKTKKSKTKKSKTKKSKTKKSKTKKSKTKKSKTKKSKTKKSKTKKSKTKKSKK